MTHRARTSRLARGAAWTVLVASTSLVTVAVGSSPASAFYFGTCPGYSAPVDYFPGFGDADGDGLSDSNERSRGTDPYKRDTDGGGTPDGEEIHSKGTNPLNAGDDTPTADTDDDGLRDGVEVTRTRTNPLRRDTDGDRLGDGREATQTHTNPLRRDTDGRSDRYEIRHGTRPTKASKH